MSFPAFLSSLALLLTLSTTIAQAETISQVPSAPEPENSVTLSLADAIPFVASTLELSWEQRRGANTSSSLVGAYGAPLFAVGDTLDAGRVAMLGGRGDYYLLGDFGGGISAGTELTAAHIDDAHGQSFLVASLGAYLSAKHVLDSGWTFGARGGYLAARSSKPVQARSLFYRSLYGAGRGSKNSSNPFFTVIVGKSF